MQELRGWRRAMAAPLVMAACALPGSAQAQERPDVRTVPQSGKTERLSELPEAHIRNIHVAPGTVNSLLQFTAPSNAGPVVQVSPDAPVRDPERRWSFRAPVARQRATERIGTGTYQLTVGNLQAGRRYHYIITVPSSDPARPWQVTGQFSTQPAVATIATGDKLTESAAFHFRDVRVEPTATRVSIAFRGLPEQVPFVEISRGAPRKDLDGRMEFRHEDLVGGYPMGGSPRTGDYRIEIGESMELQQGQRYHYLINVASGNVRRPYQETGTFVMQSQSVRVVFTSIHIGNDSDQGGGGELGFVVWVNGVGRAVNGGNVLALRTDQVHAVSEDIVVENVPDRLVLHVDGWDDDSDVITEAAAAWSRFGTSLVEPRFSGPGKDATLEWNVARQEWDLSRHPGTNPARIAFVLSSMPNGGDKGRLSFSVMGHLEITRQ
jgi:hypothetical protein